MVPEISTAVALISIVEKMGGWGVGGLLALLFLVPPVLAYMSVRIVVKALYALRQQIASSEANTELALSEFSRRYDNNMEFVRNYEKVADALAEIIRRNTMVMTKLVDRIDGMRKAQ